MSRLFAWIASLFEPSGRGRSMNFNHGVGRYRVAWSDGNVSLPMCKDVAEDYAKLFGGTVERIPAPTKKEGQQ